jgi:hypothetical protein
LWRGIVPVHQPLAIQEILSAESMDKHLVRIGAARPGDRVVLVGMHDGTSENSPGVVAHLVSG